MPIFLLGFSTCAYSQTITLPTMDEFLASLLGVSIYQILPVSENFSFIDVNPANITFYFVAANNEITVLNSSNVNLINQTLETISLVHGWLDAYNTTWLLEMADNYHQNGDVNVIIVDWSIYADSLDYAYSASAVQSVGYDIANFILEITNGDVALLGRHHLVGHSLGAHVIGFAGKFVNANSAGQLGRLTGLDAAGPLFTFPIVQPTTNRIYETDALFVDAFFTNAGGSGTTVIYAKVSIWFNDGLGVGIQTQPECLTLNLLSDLDIIDCSHEFSHIYFNDSISSPTKYKAYSCPNAIDFSLGLCAGNPTVYAGQDISETASGSYYLDIDSY